MRIKDLPWYDQPHQRLKRYGAGSLTDAELLMIILGNVKGEGVLELSNKLLKKYNLHKLYDLGFESLKSRKYKSYSLIIIIFENMKIYASMQGISSGMGNNHIKRLHLLENYHKLQSL